MISFSLKKVENLPNKRVCVCGPSSDAPHARFKSLLFLLLKQLRRLMLECHLENPASSSPIHYNDAEMKGESLQGKRHTHI